jgi:uncharacterized protein with von Willebrand factor type A (vWA) domain
MARIELLPAKQVALGLSELILSKYRKDSLNIVLFGDEAREVSVSELPFVSVVRTTQTQKRDWNLHAVFYAGKRTRTNKL